MDRRLFLTLLLLVLGAGVVWYLRDAGPPELDLPDETKRQNDTEREDLRGDRSANDRPEPGRSRIDDAVVGGADEPPAYRAALAGLRGRLIWARSREPLAGVEVRAIEAWLDAVVPTLDDLVGAKSMRSPVVFKGQDRSDKDGVFMIRGVHGRSMMVLAIGLKTEVAALAPVARTPAPGELVDLGDIEIVERGTVTGRVIDEAGKGVAGARVRIADLPKAVFQFGVEHFDPEGMGLIVQGPYRVPLEFPPWLKDYDEVLPFGDGLTRGDGRFEIRGVQPGEPTLLVSKAGMAPTTASITVLGEQVNDVGDVRIGEGEFLSGRFVDTDGKSVQGIRVTAGAVAPLLPGGLLKKPIPVDAEGKFEIAGLPRGSLYLCYRRSARQPWEVKGPHRGDDDVKIVLGAMQQGEVQIVAKTGNGPVPGLSFDLFIADVSAYLPGFETHLSGDGHFFQDPERPDTWRVRELPEGIYKVITKAPGFAFGTGVLDLSKGSKKRTEVIEMYPAPQQRFEVRDEKGKPVHAARVYWNPTAGRSMESSKRRRLTHLPLLLGKTDAAGVLVVDSVEEGANRFYCRHPAFALARSDAAVKAGTAIRFVLGRTGRLIGDVSDNGRVPVNLCTIVAEPKPDLWRKFAGVLTPRLTTSLPDGSFVFSDLQPGAWRLRAMQDFSTLRSPAAWRNARDAGGPWVDVEIEAGAEGFARLGLRESAAAGGGSLVGSVRIGGKAAEGAWVQTWGGRNRAEVDESGAFALTGLADGNVFVSVERDGHEGLLPNRLWEGRIEIRDGGRQVLDLDLMVADVTIEVVDSAGRPVAGAPIELLGVPQETGAHSGRVRMVVPTDGSGRAAFAAVPAGAFTVRSRMQRNPTMVIPEQQLQVYGSQPVTRRLVASAPGGATGTIVWDETGTEAQRAYARARRPNFLVFESSGNFIWGPVKTVDGRAVFETTPAAPGTYHLSSRGELRWTSSPLVVAPGGTKDSVVTLRPDAAQLPAAKKGSETGTEKGKK